MDKSLRLIFIEDDAAEADRMAGAVKISGVTVKSQRVTDAQALSAALNEHPRAVVLCDVDASSLKLEQVLAITGAKEVNVPVIALAARPNASVPAVMQQGAVDLVLKNQPEHLKLVVIRTAQSQQRWHASKQIEESLRESERRCRALLESSRDAIGYVHEGMHVYANPSYLELFGYSGLADIEGTPIMDLVEQDHQQALKGLLRAHDKANDTEPGPDIGLKRLDDETFTARMILSAARIDGENCIQVVIRRESYASVAPESVAVTRREPAPVTTAHEPREGETKAQSATVSPQKADQPRVEASTSQPAKADEDPAQSVREALRHQRVRLVFQPIVSLRGESGERFEVTLRALDASGGELSLIQPPRNGTEPLAIAGELDRWMLENAVERLGAACETGRDVHFFITLSAATITDEGLPAWLDKLTQSHKLPPGRLVIGISEQTMVAHFKPARVLVQKLHDMAALVTLDDFSAEPNAFELLETVPADFLRVRADLLFRLARDPQRQEKLREALERIHAMTRVSIVPCVDDAAMLSIMWGFGINFVHGNFLRAPTDTLDYDFSSLE
ncbi:MAG: EAL domain-containing protein [Gammaproteobacteria bacterium]|nr:EAL domain-containing protein [Gammaproteobacteria bacterium]